MPWMIPAGILGLFVLVACSAYSDIAVSGAQRAIAWHKDGMVLVYVPAGEFLMGTVGGRDDEIPQHLVSLDAFWLDQTEVSNGMYARCIQDGACTPLAHPRVDMEEHPNFPVQGVAWQQAVAYCEWAGRRLPSEAEWEKAARGGDSRLYPWGNEVPNSELANFRKFYGDVIDVGSLPAGASPYGALDLAGSVYEWVSDWYGADYYQQSPDQNPTGAETGIQRVLRGGAWNSGIDNLRSANRFWAFPGRNDFDGFRCALSAD